MTDRLTEEQLVALESGPHGIVFADLVADLRAARAERDALLVAREPSAAGVALASLARVGQRLSLALSLLAAERDALRDRLERAREALNQWAGRTGERHPSRCPWNDYEHDEEAIPACDCGLASLRAALEGETT